MGNVFVLALKSVLKHHPQNWLLYRKNSRCQLQTPLFYIQLLVSRMSLAIIRYQQCLGLLLSQFLTHPK